MAGTSRRRFLGTVGGVTAVTAARAPAAAPRSGRRRSRLSPKDGVRRISENRGGARRTRRVDLEPDVVRLEVPPRSQSARAFRIRVPAGRRPPSPRLAIAADVVSDGRYLGQITEAVVEVETP
jgi:hypothetical protein